MSINRHRALLLSPLVIHHYILVSKKLGTSIINGDIYTILYLSWYTLVETNWEKLEQQKLFVVKAIMSLCFGLVLIVGLVNLKDGLNFSAPKAIIVWSGLSDNSNSLIYCYYCYD